jgi:hypothetical protein
MLLPPPLSAVSAFFAIFCHKCIPTQLAFDFFFSEDIYITGNVDSLQDWSPDSALILSPANYPTWSSTCSTVEIFKR